MFSPLDTARSSILLSARASRQLKRSQQLLTHRLVFTVDTALKQITEIALHVRFRG